MEKIWKEMSYVVYSSKAQHDRLTYEYEEECNDNMDINSLNLPKCLEIKEK